MALMETSEHQLVTQRRPLPPAPVNSVTPGSSALLDPLELESLKLIMDASLRVHARHHFFTWTQGLLQNLVKHEALICALRNAEPMSFHVESFSTSPLEPALLSDVFRRDTSMVPFLHQAWVRTQIDRPVESGAVQPAGAGLLTSREQEVLKWIHLGKSNIEIGTILEISPLTVKNHVQKILRKLNVQNRTQ